jgi:hypothetical protein
MKGEEFEALIQRNSPKRVTHGSNVIKNSNSAETVPHTTLTPQGSKAITLNIFLFLSY